MAPSAPKSGRRGDEKPAGRVALETPYARAHTSSVERGMERGIPPKGLPGLLTWFREVTADELPTAIHRSGIWRDPGEGVLDKEAGKGSQLHAPAHTDPFVRFMRAVDEPSQVDPDGFYRFPVRACLSRLNRRHPLTARTLYQLSLNGGDTRRLAERLCYPDEFMELYLERALFLMWREFSTQRLRLA